MLTILLNDNTIIHCLITIYNNIFVDHMRFAAIKVVGEACNFEWLKGRYGYWKWCFLHIKKKNFFNNYIDKIVNMTFDYTYCHQSAI